MSTPISGHKAMLEVAGASVAMTTEACTVISGTGNANWRITDATKNVFYWGATLTVEAEDGVYNTLGADEFTIKWLTGTIEIDNYTSGSANVANITNVRVTGQYLPLYEMVEAQSAQVELVAALLMASVFGNDGERRILGRADASVTYKDLMPFYVPIDSPTDAEEQIIAMVANATTTVASIYPDRDNTNYAIRVLVNVEGDAISMPGGDVLSSDVSMVGSVQTSAMSTQPVLVWELLE